VEHYDQTVIDLAKAVAKKLNQFSDAEIKAVADWLVHEGGDNGGSVATLSARFKLAH